MNVMLGTYKLRIDNEIPPPKERR